jgi:coenzyme F420 hydrogenase subunit beta
MIAETIDHGILKRSTFSKLTDEGLNQTEYNKGIRVISDNDLCISCGACIHMCLHDNICIDFNKARGKWDVSAKNTEICEKCNDLSNCLTVCPSYNVNYMELARSDKNHLLGRIKNVYNGYAKDQHLRFSSSSGGFVRVLCKTLIESKKIDGVISITHEGGMEYFPQIVTEIAKMPNSIYHNINYQNAINLIQKNSGKYLLIGLPCQVTGIELFLRKNRKQRLKGKIYAKISLMCGYTFDRKNIQAFAYFNAFPMKEVSYRGGGRFWKNRLKNDLDEILIEAVHPKGLRDKINNMICFDRFIVQTACLYCVDHLGYCADLVVGDAWQAKYNSDTIGTNMIITRTELGEEIISVLEPFQFEKGYKEEIIESQTPNYALGAIGEGMKSINLKGHYFTPVRKRTDHQPDIVTYKFSIKDIIKIKIIKNFIRKERFRMAKCLYALLEARVLFKALLRP